MLFLQKVHLIFTNMICLNWTVTAIIVFLCKHVLCDDMKQIETNLNLVSESKPIDLQDTSHPVSLHFKIKIIKIN